MRDLSKTKITNEWKTKTGRVILQLRKGRRGADYIAFLITVSGTNMLLPRDFRDMRRTQLAEAARWVGELLTDNQVEQGPAEIALDLIYSELNRRLGNA